MIHQNIHDYPILRKTTHIGNLFSLDEPLAVGTLQWGTTWVDQKVINSKGCISETDANLIFQYLTKEGITLFDTAEGYGGGTSEKRLGRCANRNDPSATILMTKYLPLPWRWHHNSFEKALRASLERMNIPFCPIYLIHSPVHWRPIEYWVEAAAICKRKGLLKSLGLSNCNADEVRRAVIAGKKYGVPVVLNQVHYSLLVYKSPALQKMEKICKELGVTVVAYSPLGQGLLTDGLNMDSFASNKPAKMLRLKKADDIMPLRACIRRIADNHKMDQATMAQVAINWSIAHGAIPLVGCRSLKQAKDTLASLKWSLTKEEVKELDSFALKKGNLESPRWRRGLFVILAGVIMNVCHFLDWIGLGMVSAAIGDDKKELLHKEN